MRIIRRTIIPLSLLLVSAICFMPMNLALTLTDGKKHQLVLVQPMRVGEHFIIKFIHSIHRTPVVEDYYVNKKLQIVLNQVTYETYGVGNPSSIEPGETYQHIGKKYIIGNMHRVMPYFDQAIGQVIANHQLQIKGKWIALSKVTTPGNWVRIQVKRVSLWTLWKGESE